MLERPARPGEMVVTTSRSAGLLGMGGLGCGWLVCLDEKWLQKPIKYVTGKSDRLFCRVRSPMLKSLEAFCRCGSGKRCGLGPSGYSS